MLSVGHEKGFTLLEVMIALAIIGIALVTLIGAGFGGRVRRWIG